jgi:hypothetical protein
MSEALVRELSILSARDLLGATADRASARLHRAGLATIRVLDAGDDLATPFTRRAGD